MRPAPSTSPPCSSSARRPRRCPRRHEPTRRGLTLWLRRDPRSGLRRRGLRGVAFNAAQQMLATGLAGLVYYALLPHTAPAPSTSRPISGRSRRRGWRSTCQHRRGGDDGRPAAGPRAAGCLARGLARGPARSEQPRPPRPGGGAPGRATRLGAAAAGPARSRCSTSPCSGRWRSSRHVRRPRSHAPRRRRRAGAAYLAGASAALAASLDYPATLAAGGRTRRAGPRRLVQRGPGRARRGRAPRGRRPRARHRWRGTPQRAGRRRSARRAVAASS